MDKSIDEDYENTSKQWDEMNITVQDMEKEIVSLNKTQTEVY